MHRRKKDATQQLVIPKGMILPGEAAVIEIPRRYQRAPIIILKRKGGEVAHMRAEDHFVPASNDPPEEQKPPAPAPTPEPAPVLVIKPDINPLQFQHDCSVRIETTRRPTCSQPQLQQEIEPQSDSSFQQQRIMSPVTPPRPIAVNQCGTQGGTCPPVQPLCSTPSPSRCTHGGTCSPTQPSCAVPRPNRCTHGGTCSSVQPSCAAPRSSRCTDGGTCPPAQPLCSLPRPTGTCPPVQPLCSLPRPSGTCPPVQPLCSVPRPSRCTVGSTCPPVQSICSLPKPSRCGTYSPPCQYQPPCFSPTPSQCSRNVDLNEREQCELDMFQSFERENDTLLQLK
ncbi:vegetative cell wall protein gp1-like isoform X3 [Tribolium madens]|uniref:vegetative cell wall protein gp1-like isoform X3 n=1 Tax=Tribolium madens TaxID=41895 RepID=UPI001CF72268|nr:vegetative cell wall protein gp1-like isoform X3 [Tribolium madens]